MAISIQLNVSETTPICLRPSFNMILRVGWSKIFFSKFLLNKVNFTPKIYVPPKVTVPPIEKIFRMWFRGPLVIGKDISWNWSVVIFRIEI